MSWSQSRTACRKPLLLVDVESSFGENYFKIEGSCENFLRILFTPYLVSLYLWNHLTYFDFKGFTTHLLNFKTRIKIVGCFLPITPCQVANVSEFYPITMLRNWSTSSLSVLFFYIISCILNPFGLSCTIPLFLPPMNVLIMVLLFDFGCLLRILPVVVKKRWSLLRNLFLKVPKYLPQFPRNVECLFHSVLYQFHHMFNQVKPVGIIMLMLTSNDWWFVISVVSLVTIPTNVLNG